MRSIKTYEPWSPNETWRADSSLGLVLLIASSETPGKKPLARWAGLDRRRRAKEHFLIGVSVASRSSQKSWNFSFPLSAHICSHTVFIAFRSCKVLSLKRAMLASPSGEVVSTAEVDLARQCSCQLSVTLNCRPEMLVQDGCPTTRKRLSRRFVAPCYVAPSTRM